MDAKKLIICMAAVLLICGSRQVTAHAYDIYSSDVPEGVILIYQRILTGVSPADDYMLFCAGENEYVMLVGDLERNGTTFTGEAATEYKITYRAASTDLSYSVSDITVGSIDVSDSLIYTNLGAYPMIEERSDLYEMFEVVTLLIMLFTMLVFSVFQLNKSRRLQGR